MLIIKAYINEKQIDEIWIHNLGIGRTDPYHRLGELYTYRIEKPEGYEQNLIEHSRSSDGWQVLAKKALKILT